MIRKSARGLRLTLAFALNLIVLFAIFNYRNGGTLVPNPRHARARHDVRCFPPRKKPASIKVPAAQDDKFLAGLWDTLRPLFDQHKPEPAHIDKPAPEKKPGESELGSFFDLTDEEADLTRARHEELVGKLPPYPQQRFGGRGVVILAGGRYSEFAAITLGMLRESGSRLPVELWFDDGGDDEWCRELEPEGVACRRLTEYMSLDDLPSPYQWKVFTMLYSTFEEILFIDADSMPVKNPDSVFESAVFQSNGVILWPDYWTHTGSPWLPYLVGINDTRKSDMLVREMSIESGQIYWNKKTHWKSLVLAAYYNYFGPDFWYTVFNNGWAGWGDKDAFVVACKAAQQPYYQVPHSIVTIFLQGTTDGIGMLQGDPTNRAEHTPLFMHINMIKMSMREVLCSEDCTKSERQGDHPFHMIDENSRINKHLREGRRLYAVAELFEANIDPEPDVWRVLEHTACRTHRGSRHMCKNARDHMERTFGFKFTADGDEGGDGDARVCIEGPWAQPSTARPKPDNWTRGDGEDY
ncbi:Alpha-mannosyltransferase [Metarhizium album ARSEF 1941]|uniref:Alpha-mannosyltransferase n=1 Tax=Metarhizium album (strain ARSEF 1941) TaxID=1081103 RepID=A0A0B2WN04_METAS|nr:Alpha-mannosyltransferase [Metarhizium album ARSEF 1941]KHN94872.1 Alpha-mannosyltransferase [Metarhizium album ARSEF 1941]